MRLCKGSLAWHRDGVCLQIGCYTKPEWFPDNTNISFHFRILKTVDFAGRWFWGTPISGKKTRTFYDWKQLCNDKHAQIQWQQSKLPCMIHCESPQRSETTTWTWRGKSGENHGKNKSADRPSVRFTNSKQLESNWNFISSLIGVKFISSNLQPTIQTVKQVIHWRCLLAFESHTVDGRNLANQLRLVVYPNSYRVFVHLRSCRISSINSSTCNQWVPCPMKQAQDCFDSETPFLTYEAISFAVVELWPQLSTATKMEKGYMATSSPNRPHLNCILRDLDTIPWEKNSHTNSYVSGCGLTRENNMFHRNTSTQRCPCFQKIVQFMFTQNIVAKNTRKFIVGISRGLK